MPKVSFMYPSYPTSFDELQKHPRFLVLLDEKPDSKLAPLKHAMVAFISDKRFAAPEGVPLTTFIASRGQRDPAVMHALVEELAKMNAFVVTRRDGESWLVPYVAASEREGAEASRVVSTRIPAKSFEALKALADKRYNSASALVAQAVEEFLAKQDGIAV